MVRVVESRVHWATGKVPRAAWDIELQWPKVRL
jgi:hypothetical protein